MSDETGNAFVTHMTYFVDHPEKTKAFGDASREISALYTLDRGVERFCQALAKLVPTGN